MCCPWLARSVLALTIVTPLAVRAGATEPVHLHYDAPDGCPAADAFVAEVQARTPRMRLATEEEAGLTLRVTVVRADGRLEGTLVVVDASGAESRREVSGDSCATVTLALALVAALRIDPMASTTALPADPVSSVSTIPSEATTLAPNETSSIAPLSTPPPPTPASKPDASAAAHRSVSLQPSRRRIRFAGAFGLDILGFVPQSVVFGASVLGEVAFDGSGILAPEARIGGSLTESRSLSTNDGTGVLMWSRGLFEVCPLRFQLAPSLDVRPCVTSAGGGLHVQGHGTGTSEPPTTKPWIEVGGAALMEWTLIGPLALQGEAGFSLPLARETFFFAQSPTSATETTVYHVPSIVGGARLGFAVRFL
jgi:hypothetical protein